jgi:ribonucleotide reductase alpha subunit
MPQEQLTVRSTKARDLAHELARKQRRTVSQVVEMALERYSTDTRETRVAKESATDFWARIAKMTQESEGPDIDLMEIINQNRKPHEPIKL